MLSNGTKGRYWEGGLAKQLVLSLFIERQHQFVDGVDAYESELDENGDPIPLTRNSYTREYKLVAIDYALHT
jgi:hypothetical protein